MPESRPEELAPLASAPESAPPELEPDPLASVPESAPPEPDPDPLASVPESRLEEPDPLASTPELLPLELELPASRPESTWPELEDFASPPPAVLPTGFELSAFARPSWLPPSPPGGSPVPFEPPQLVASPAAAMHAAMSATVCFMRSAPL
jgi:hypothetical protein